MEGGQGRAAQPNREGRRAVWLSGALAVVVRPRRSFASRRSRRENRLGKSLATSFRVRATRFRPRVAWRKCEGRWRILRYCAAADGGGPARRGLASCKAHPGSGDSRTGGAGEARDVIAPRGHACHSGLRPCPPRAARRPEGSYRDLRRGPAQGWCGQDAHPRWGDRRRAREDRLEMSRGSEDRDRRTEV